MPIIQTYSHYEPRPHTLSLLFSLIHGDIWGPSRFENITGTRLSWTFLMKKTSQIFQTFHKMIQNQFQANSQVFKTNNARDFFNSILRSYFNLMQLYIKAHLWTHPNKMVWLNAKIATCLRWQILYYSHLMFLKIFGERLSELQPIS